MKRLLLLLIALFAFLSFSTVDAERVLANEEPDRLLGTPGAAGAPGGYGYGYGRPGRPGAPGYSGRGGRGGRGGGYGGGRGGRGGRGARGNLLFSRGGG